MIDHDSSAALMPTPRLRALVTPAKAPLPAQAHAFCDWCERIHHHSACDGHRAAHCTHDDSPYKATGYVLDVQGPATAVEEVLPEALFAGRRQLWERLDKVELRLRSTLLRATVGASLARISVARVGRARIMIHGASWSIEPDAYLSEAEMRGPVKRSRIRFGSDFICILAALYGLARGVAGVRVLEAVTGAKFGGEGRAIIAAAIEEAYLRAPQRRP